MQQQPSQPQPQASHRPQQPPQQQHQQQNNQQPLNQQQYGRLAAGAAGGGGRFQNQNAPSPQMQQGGQQGGQGGQGMMGGQQQAGPGGMIGVPGVGMMHHHHPQQQFHYGGGSDPQDWKLDSQGMFHAGGGGNGGNGSGVSHSNAGGPLPTLQPSHQLHSLRSNYPPLGGNSPQFSPFDPSQPYRMQQQPFLNAAPPHLQHPHQQHNTQPQMSAMHHQQNPNQMGFNPSMPRNMFNPAMASEMRMGGGGPTLPSLMDPDLSSYPSHLPPSSFEPDPSFLRAGPSDPHFLGSVSPNTVHAPSPTFSPGSGMGGGGPGGYHGGGGGSSSNAGHAHNSHLQHHPNHPHDHLPSGPDTILPYTPEAFKHSLLNHRFEDKDLALDFIKDTAKKFGFSVLVRTSKPDYVVVICNCGRRLKKLKNERKRNRKFKTAMTGCGWRVVLFRNAKRLFEFRGTPKMEHNHELPVEVLPMV